MQTVTKKDLLEEIQNRAIHYYISRSTFDMSDVMSEVTIGVDDELICENESLYIEWECVTKITKEVEINFYNIFLKDNTFIQIEII
jgi:hypothetical protein